MTNHPSRGWRRRAQAAADAEVARWRWDPRPDGAYILTREQLAGMVRDIYLRGFEAGRTDQRAPKAAP